MPINAGSDMPGNTSGLGKDGSASFLMSNFLIFLHVFSGQDLLHSGITAVIVALFPERAEASAPLARARAWALEECVKQAAREAEKRLIQGLKSIETYMISKIREWLLRE